METNILDLPNELLLEILKFLNLNATINVDDCICRRWRDIGEYSRLWSELKLKLDKERLGNSEERMKMSRLKELKHVTLQEGKLKDKHLERSNVIHITFGTEEFPMNYNYFCDMSQVSPLLLRLEVKCSHFCVTV